MGIGQAFMTVKERGKEREREREVYVRCLVLHNRVYKYH